MIKRANQWVANWNSVALLSTNDKHLWVRNLWLDNSLRCSLSSRFVSPHCVTSDTQLCVFLLIVVSLCLTFPAMVQRVPFFNLSQKSKFFCKASIFLNLPLAINKLNFCQSIRNCFKIKTYCFYTLIDLLDGVTLASATVCSIKNCLPNTAICLLSVYRFQSLESIRSNASKPNNSSLVASTCFVRSSMKFRNSNRDLNENPIYWRSIEVQHRLLSSIRRNS